METDRHALMVQLHRLLSRHFNLEEVHNLCFDLGVDYESLPGQGKAGKARELIAYLDRRSQLPRLVAWGQQWRPEVDWPAVPGEDGELPPWPEPRRPRPAQVERADRFADCVFISYSRVDQAYARRLADALRGRGFKPWMDDRIDFGDRWWRTIVRAIRACRAFVVLMTPESEESEWVEREVQLALRERKPVYPLLLRGREFPLLITTQYLDVTDGRLPAGDFYDRLGRVLGIPGAPEPSMPVREVKAERVEPEDRAPAVPAPSVPVQRVGERQPFEPELALIPAGEFRMGSDPRKDKDTYDDEQPQHRLYLPDYYLARTPVTNAQYLAFVQATSQGPPEHWQGGKPPKGKDEHPVVNVSWHDAMAYCRWLAQVTGRPYRLPSEAEWEKGARGVDGRIYPWGDEWDAARCNSSEGGRGDTTPVGAYPQGASPYDLLDMAGNVWEWTRSLWGKSWKPDFGYPYNPEDGREDESAGNDVLRVVRGGAFLFTSGRVRCAFRDRYVPADWFAYIGFRVVVGPG